MFCFFFKDLDVDDIMVLDGGDEIYVWIGDGSTKEEKEKSIDMAKVRFIYVFCSDNSGTLRYTTNSREHWRQ